MKLSAEPIGHVFIAIVLAVLNAANHSIAAEDYIISSAHSPLMIVPGAMSAPQVIAPMAMPRLAGAPEAVSFQDAPVSGPATQIASTLPKLSNRAYGTASLAMKGKATSILKGAGTSIDEQLGLYSIEWYKTAPPFTLNTPMRSYREFPNSALGKLFISEDGDAWNYVCSASSVTHDPATSNGQTIITAGHCCSPGDGSPIYSNFEFVPSYLNGNAPAGRWQSISAVVPSAWLTEGDLTRDVCVIRVENNDIYQGQNLHDVIGALGIEYNAKLPRHYCATGWPAGAPFNGELLWINSASNSETDTAQAGESPFTHGIGNPMTKGSSGGAWITNYAPGIQRGNYFNGLNSYVYVSIRPGVMYGPYIDGYIYGMLKDAGEQ